MSEENLYERDCGCGNGCGSDSECNGCCGGCGVDGDATVTLDLDDGTVIECQVVTIFPAGGRQYIALLPLDENGRNEDGEVYLYRFSEVGGEPHLDNIESDEEYEIASDGFDEWLDSSDFDEIISAEEAEEENPDR